MTFAHFKPEPEPASPASPSVAANPFVVGVLVPSGMITVKRRT